MAKRGSNKTKRGSNKTIALYLPYQGWQPRHDDSGSKMLELGFVTVEGAKVCNPSDMEEYAHFHDLALITYVRWQDYNGNRVWEPGMHSWECEYRSVYSVDARTARRMCEMFKRIGRIAFPFQPVTFGQYVALVLAGLKVKTVVTATSAGSWHTETSHQITDTRYVAEAVDALVEDFKYRVRPDLRMTDPEVAGLPVFNMRTQRVEDGAEVAA